MKTEYFVVVKVGGEISECIHCFTKKRAYYLKDKINRYMSAVDDYVQKNLPEKAKNNKSLQIDVVEQFVQ